MFNIRASGSISVISEFQIEDDDGADNTATVSIEWFFVKYVATFEMILLVSITVQNTRDSYRGGGELPPLLNQHKYTGTGLESRMLRTFFINCWKFMLHRTKNDFIP